mmetsp:Transcript_27144/g.67679  ORF Transcript_27144/g.67679 Transcript_27144/m.67679 type:complete len:81 (-) Transcript_27144:1154-1396(-)
MKEPTNQPADRPTGQGTRQPMLLARLTRPGDKYTQTHRHHTTPGNHSTIHVAINASTTDRCACDEWGCGGVCDVCVGAKE